MAKVKMSKGLKSYIAKRNAGKGLTPKQGYKRASAKPVIARPVTGRSEGRTIPGGRNSKL